MLTPIGIALRSLYSSHGRYALSIGIHQSGMILVSKRLLDVDGVSSTYMYLENLPFTPSCRIPKDKERFFTVRHETILKPGDQYTIPPTGFKPGAIISEFLGTSRDEHGIFTDPCIRRIAEIVDR